MKAIFVHLSDIHFGQEKDGGSSAQNADAKLRLIDDARAEISGLEGKVHGVIVTGDIAYSGKPDEYAAAADWLAQLTDAIGCERTDVQMVPGNHDIDRKQITNTIDSVLFAVREGGDEWLDRHLDNEDDCAVLYKRFDAYKGFALDYRCELDLNGSISQSAKLTLAPGREIRFVRLNSALICSSREEYGKLILGKRQRLLPIEPGVEIIVLSHHPLSWFQDSENARGYLRGRARVFISGHEHFPSLEIDSVADDCHLMMLAAGATAPDEHNEKYTYKYNILTFEWDEVRDALAVTINPRTWDSGVARFRRDDGFLEGKSARQVLGSPNFKAASRPSRQGDTNYAEESLLEESSSLIDVAAFVEDPAVQDPSMQTQSNERARDAITVAGETAQSQRARDAQLRFFQEIPAGGRIKAFSELGVIDQIKGGVDHSMERILFRRAVRKGMLGRIEQLLSEVKENNGDLKS